jgi:hypothetical protein
MAELWAVETVGKRPGADLGKIETCETIRYGLTRKAEFHCFPEDGRVEIDNNSVHAEATCAYWWPSIIS